MSQFTAVLLANFMGDTWYHGYLERKDSKNPIWKNYSIFCKTKALIAFDRELNYQINGIEYESRKTG